MWKSALFALAFAGAVLLSACSPQQDEATKYCLSGEGTHQDCGIACTISKSEEACKKWEKLTIELCDKVGKQQCQEICEADNNEFACTKAKSM